MSSPDRLHAGVERTIAVRFALLVSAVLVLAIGSYATVDLVVAGARLDRTLAMRAERMANRPGRGGGDGAPPGLGEACVLDASGRTISPGGGFPSLEGPLPRRGFATLRGPDGDFRVYAAALPDGGSLLVAERARADSADLIEKVLLLSGVSVLVTVLVYVIGLRFARRSLTPMHATLSRLEQFTADAGHELRTPLAAVGAQLELAERTGDYRKGVADAREELDRATVLVERLLEIARLDSASLRREDIDLGAAVRAIVCRYEATAAERRLSVSADGSGAAMISADPVLLERLLANLVENAVRFADPGSVVTIGWDRASLTVHNTGDPVPPDMMPRLFDPFFQADASRAGGGFGLGLAIAARIAALHGWSLSASSSPDSGTVFTVAFADGRP